MTDVRDPSGDWILYLVMLLGSFTWAYYYRISLNVTKLVAVGVRLYALVFMGMMVGLFVLAAVVYKQFFALSLLPVGLIAGLAESPSSGSRSMKFELLARWVALLTIYATVAAGTYEWIGNVKELSQGRPWHKLSSFAGPHTDGPVDINGPKGFVTFSKSEYNAAVRLDDTVYIDKNQDLHVGLRFQVYSFAVCISVFLLLLPIAIRWARGLPWS